MEASERIITHRTDRLAEMVWHLTDCHPLQALAAIGEPSNDEDALAVVARAMCRIRHLDLRDHIDLRDRSRSDIHQAATQP